MCKWLHLVDRYDNGEKCITLFGDVVNDYFSVGFQRFPPTETRHHPRTFILPPNGAAGLSYRWLQRESGEQLRG